MSIRRRKNNLTGDQKRFICRLFAEFAEPTEIQCEVEKAFGFRLALSTIYHYRDADKWRSVVETFRADLVKKLTDIPLCSKFYRLKKLDQLFHDENRYRVVRYSGKSEIPIEEKPVGELRQLCALVAQELGELKQVLEHDASASLEEIILGALAHRGQPPGR